MKRVIQAAALAITGLLLQGKACTTTDFESALAAALGEVHDYEAEEAAEAKRQQEIRDSLDRTRQEERAYYDAVVRPTGEYENYEEYVDELHEDPAFRRAEAKKEAEWKHQQGYKTPAEHKAEEEYYDKKVLGTGEFPSLEAYREAKKKDPGVPNSGRSEAGNLGA